MSLYVDLPELPIRLGASGAWRHGDTPLHPRVAKLFARSLEPQADGGYAIVLGHARQTVEVQDVAWFVSRLQLQPAADDPTRLAAATLHLSDGSSEPLRPDQLMQSCERVLYCRIERHGYVLPARFAPQQYHQLMLFAEAVPDAAAPDGVAARLRVGEATAVVGAFTRAPHPIR